MAKGESVDTLLKRLQKIERAQGRLGDLTTRIRVQADTLAELLKVAQGFVTEKPAAKSASRARSTSAARKAAATAPRATKRTPAAPTTRAKSSAAGATRSAASSATATRRSSRTRGSV